MPERTGPILIVVGVGALLGLAALLFMEPGGRGSPSEFAAPPSTSVITTVQPTTSTIVVTTTTMGATTTTTEVLVRRPDTIPAWTVGQPWGFTSGLTMFRGNPTRTYYGTGPLSGSPTQLWQYPGSPMCSTSSVAGEAKVWCGTGWTGQPVVYERADGVTELIFGAYDRAVHFVDAATGTELRPKFVTGDIIKGSVTLDPDGYPLLYFGSRDNKLRIIALDRDEPELLWSLNANAVRGIWNNDWDANPAIIDDILYEGGENGWFFAFQLNREYLDDGRVGVTPTQLVAMPGYDADLIDKSGRNVSIESSVVAYEQRVYFANSGGRVVGLDVSNIREGVATRMGFYTSR